ncbi:hypothetical protein H9Q10_07345 [Eikenella sp. S3360]|uniref:Uncharacterized protein n=1 Tax=Eikenella glucosivorans TaxID=2766967 RepID=A0ABS0NB36_9NEIS|nr:hypothetical protein [Eikenella glucosivorans]MBH5329480.1 hypothetical protein [Eikenella glucosivorans]
MITKLRITIRLLPEKPAEYRVCTVSNRNILAKLNKAEVSIYVAGCLRLMPEQVIKWEKAPEEFYQADKLLELMFSDGFIRYNSENDPMLLKQFKNDSDDDSIYDSSISFKLEDLQKYDSRSTPEIKGLFIGAPRTNIPIEEHVYFCPVLVSLDTKQEFQPKLKIEYDVDSFDFS